MCSAIAVGTSIALCLVLLCRLETALCSMALDISVYSDRGCTYDIALQRKPMSSELIKFGGGYSCVRKISL